MTKGGRAVIMASEASQVLFQRSPVDAMGLAQMLGVSNPTMALATVRDNAAMAFKHAHLRKTYKGVAEIVTAVEVEANESASDEEMTDQ